jgi:hypothetical protein
MLDCQVAALAVPWINNTANLIVSKRAAFHDRAGHGSVFFPPSDQIPSSLVTSTRGRVPSESGILT